MEWEKWPLCEIPYIGMYAEVMLFVLAQIMGVNSVILFSYNLFWTTYLDKAPHNLVVMLILFHQECIGSV